MLQVSKRNPPGGVGRRGVWSKEFVTSTLRVDNPGIPEPILAFWLVTTQTIKEALDRITDGLGAPGA